MREADSEGKGGPQTPAEAADLSPVDIIERSFDNTGEQPDLAMDHPRIAFVDVETTGLDPRANRITEIGLVTVDGECVGEWTTLVNPLTRRRERTQPADAITDNMRAAAPRFKDIALELERRLAGRLFIAHNARFDYGFLKSEFNRIGLEFHPDVLCSLMLSRKLYPRSPHHDLDSLMERHGLEAEVRHRALHDAKVIWQLWRVIHREHAGATVANTIGALLAGPLLPAHLDLALIDRLPEAPGVYVFHGEDDEILAAGTASNLRLHVRNYFRIDLTSARALAISHRIRSVTWRVTQGMLGARLQLALLARTLPAQKQQRGRPLFSWRFVPDAYPSLSLVSLSERPISATEECFGMFESPRKACNALVRIAADHRLCHSLLGVREAPDAACLACPAERGGAACGRRAERLRHLARAFVALRPLRVPAWPYRGPIGIRERADLHILDRWQYLGTARSEGEIDAVLETRVPDFDMQIFGLLAKSLRRLPRSKIVCLAARANAANPADQELVDP